MKKQLAKLLFATCLLTACQAEQEAETHDVQYIEGAEDQASAEADTETSSEAETGGEAEGDATAGTEVEDRTIEEVNDDEGIAAEQIVVKITDQGYVTTHGDHFHAYNGPVPENALIGEGLLTEEEGEVVSEHEAGQVVLVNGQYFFKLEDENTPLLRSEEEIASQAQGNDPGQTWPGAEFRNEKGQYTTDDGYVFDPADVSEDFGDAYLVTLSEVEHLIPKDRLTHFEIAAVEEALANK